jgi:uncharacterized protein (TIGR02453 family)
MPPDPPDTWCADARAWLTQLAANNSRDWFAAHEAGYETLLRAPASELLDRVAADLTRLTGAPTATKLFRPNRDLRFSRDKTPYHTHLHLLWTSQTGAAAPPQWYFGLSPDYVTLGGGVMAFDKPALAAWRAGVAHHGAALAGQIAALKAAGARLDPPDLARVPAPHDGSHPRADLLRRKSLALWFDLAPPVTHLPDRLAQGFARLWPMQQAMQALLAA